jgi:hypothetical protein
MNYRPAKVEGAASLAGAAMSVVMTTVYSRSRNVGPAVSATWAVVAPAAGNTPVTVPVTPLLLEHLV